MKRIIPHLYLLFISILIPNLYSQQIEFNKLNTDDGLSQSNVTCIMQDSKGFMWFGTFDGLNKFDGYNFTVNRNDPKDSTSISGNSINAIVEDKDGIIWISTSNNGLSSYNRISDEFIQYKNLPKYRNKPYMSQTRGLKVDEDNKLWVFYQNGLGIYDKENDDFTYTITSEFYQINDLNITRNIIPYKNNKRIFCKDGFPLYLIDKDDHTIETINYLPSGATTGEKKIVLFDEKENIWVSGLNHGLYELNNDFTIKKFYSKPASDQVSVDMNIRDFVQSEPGMYWAATDGNGLISIDKNNNRITYLKNEAANPHSIAGNSIWDLEVDETGILWCAHFGKGISYYNKNAKKFDAFLHDYTNPKTISKNAVLSVFEDSKNRIWIGTDGGGLNLYNKKDHTFKHYTTTSHQMTSNVITAISEDSRGNLLLGTWNGGLMVFNPITNKINHFSTSYPDHCKLPNNDVWAIKEDKNGLIWLGILGTEKTVFCYDPEKQIIQPYADMFGLKNIMTAQVMTIFEDSKHNLWFGTEGGGVYQFLIDKKEMQKFENNPQNDHSLASNIVYTITEDTKGNIWMGTQTAGISIYNPSTKSFKTINKSNGLPSNTIQGILEDDNHHFWISTTQGLSKYDPTENKIVNYDKKDGLQGNEFKYNAAIKDEHGILYFGGLSGLNSIDPARVKTNTVIPPVYFTSLMISNKVVEINGENSPLTKSISETDTIILNYKQNDFKLSFVAINYSSPEKNKYEYKLRGYDDTYIPVTDSRSANYMNLSPGEYELHVIASNNDDVWNKEGARMTIIITPPWWATWWFRSLSILLLALVLYLLIRYRMRKVKATQRLLEDKITKATAAIETRNAKLSSAQDKLKSIIDDVKSRLGGASEQLINATNSQASSIEEISASINQMVFDINKNADGATKMFDSAKNIENDADSSVQIVTKTVKSIEDINEGIGFISEFARTTNLLALNAAIEASRAGVHGRSFAVVANEVKKLADQSKEVADNIQSLSNKGLSLSQDANNKITELQSYIKNIVSLISQISESSQKQSQQVNSISEAITQISTYISTTSVLAEKLDEAINTLSIDE
jgi:methyl-accepting chemotaxis protein/ligand-binding sensor domain-containing protein